MIFVPSTKQVSIFLVLPIGCFTAGWFGKKRLVSLGAIDIVLTDIAINLG